MTKKLDPDRPNKARRGRPRKPRTNSVKLKAIWASPEGRTMMIERIRAGSVEHRKERALNPDKFTRSGIPHGHTRASVAPLWAEANRKADRFMDKLTEDGFFPDVIVPDSDEEKGKLALHAATVLALGPGEKQARLAAIRTVLEYTRSKPESKSKMTISSSEEFLAAIAASDDESK